MPLLPPYFWALLAAGCLSLALYLLLQGLFNRPPAAAKALADFAGQPAAATDAVAIGSEQHRLRLAFQQFKLNVAGHETQAKWFARVGLSLSAALLVYLLGFPLVATLGGAVLGFIAVEAFIGHTWRQQQLAIERELPTLLSSLSTTLGVEANPRQALEAVLGTLEESSALRRWLTHLLTQVQMEGQAAFKTLLPEAQALSPALGLLVFQLQRLLTTGGTGYSQAFLQSAESLGQILEARATASAKADNARGSAWIIIGSLGFTLVMLARAPEFQAALAEPILQAVYLGLIIMVAFGMQVVNGLVDNALA
jgi:hypothetical protein